MSDDTTTVYGSLSHEEKERIFYLSNKAIQILKSEGMTTLEGGTVISTMLGFFTSSVVLTYAGPDHDMDRMKADAVEGIKAICKDAQALADSAIEMARPDARRH